MRGFLAALTGFIAAAAILTAVAFAVPHGTIGTTSGMPMAGTMTSGMMGGTAAPRATAKLMIQHVQKGCHVWSNGKTTGAMMRLHLAKGQRLTILDMDVDAHQMLQLGGPARLHMGGPMMMNKSMTLTFSKAGVYHLGTKTVEMPGAMEVKTTGPDNTLRLVVAVA